eukprot:12109055-Prorocentrum_lima.AAC.1
MMMIKYQAQDPKDNQGSPTEEIREETLKMDNQTWELIKSSEEQGTDIRRCAENLKSAPVASKDVANCQGETLT